MYTKRHIVFTSVISCAVTALVAVSATKFYCNTQQDILTRAKNLICERYVDPLTDEQIKNMNDSAISAMVQSLGDPYSYYFDETTFEAYEESNEDEYIGVGITVSFHTDTNEMVIIAPTDGSPAQKAGLLPGDVILSVDGQAVTAESYDGIIDYIRGENAKEGDALTITVRRGGATQDYTVVRGTIPIESVSLKMLDSNVGYIRISKFRRNTAEGFAKALTDVQAKNAKGLVIDLRSNPGGYADTVLKIADSLLPKGVIAYLEDNQGKKEYFYSDEKCVSLPITVLVNEGTASASELLAGSLQAYDLAEIVGKKTYGKAVGQSPYMLTADTAIYLTSARYYTPKGNCIDKIGISPDYEVDLPEEKKANFTSLSVEEDPMMQKAIALLYEKIKQ